MTRNMTALSPLLHALALGALTSALASQARGQEKPSTAAGASTAVAEGKEYIDWLEKRSMLHQAGEAAKSVSGGSFQWGRPYGEPQPRAAVKAGSVWVLGYPGSVIARAGESVIATWASPELWGAFREIGVDLLHTGPVKRSGGIRGREYTPTVDGWFDRISLEIDPGLGTEAEYRRMVEVAGEHGGSIAGDLVPLHTGKGADFLLALRAYKDYPGMYAMVEVPEKDWGLLPAAADEWASAPVSRHSVEGLTAKGYLPGLVDSADAVPNAKELSGWDATGPVRGADGKTRRWLYLHYFKPGQPTLNWLDPSMAGPRAVAGDVVKTIFDLKARMVRLDAVPFLGIEPIPGTPRALGYQHPLSVMGTNQLAFLTRKLGGFSFQELNVPLSQLTEFTKNGPDLSYDFFTRAQYLHALLTGDAGPLRLAYDQLLKSDIDPVSLVHDLQNHDEFTYQLVELDFRGDDTVSVGGKPVLGRVLREQMLREMRARAAGEAAPYNLLYRAQQDGLATTTVGFIAAALKLRDPYHASPEEKADIKKAHLLVALANAMQPGVFSLSSWDLVGALPLPRESVADRMDDGDYRWINRGGVDLMGAAPTAETSAFGVPRAESLYGGLPTQLADPDSFASGLKRMLAARDDYQIDLADLLAAPETDNPSACVLVMKLPGPPRLAVTALNFGRTPIEESIDLSRLPGVPPESFRGRTARNALDEGPDAEVSATGRLVVKLDALSGKALVVGE